ncbi:major facilitator superfamily domain-containing protein [Mycena pura]|uniref:Major facilitator superfamily domain-containing protein n=1 Tax=Mycena pura TaxID=153505 RepID=A0AAD6VL39_9AGAR|nr:major facilitator superfamily domain-containing protein [Mycena pura]
MDEAPDSSVQSKRSSVVEPMGPAEAKDSDVAAPIFPEGGLQAWATVAGAFLIQFCGFGYASSFGVYEDFCKQEYLTQSSLSAISSVTVLWIEVTSNNSMHRWIGSVGTFIVMSGGLVSGPLYDRGYFYHLVIGGSLLQSFSLFMLSLCKQEQLYWIFLAQGLGVGLGAGMTYVPTVAVVSHYFQKRRALAMSIVVAGTPMGALVHPIMLNNTLRGHLGFGNAVRASAGLVSGLLLIACLLMRPRLPPPAAGPPLWKTLKRFSRDGVYTLAVAGMTTFTVGFYFPVFYLQLDAVTHGVNQALAFYSLVILNGSAFVGRLCMGFFAQRLGVINMIIVATGCGAVLILIALKSAASVVVIGLIYGFWASACGRDAHCAGLAPVLVVLTENMGEFGLRMGFAFWFIGLSALCGPPINGALLTDRLVWWRPALFSGMMSFIGFCFLVAMAVAVRRRAAAQSKQEEDAFVGLESETSSRDEKPLASPTK